MRPSPENPKVGIVLAVYNGADHLGAQVESCLQQDLPPVEMVITDDGSTDDGLERTRAVAQTASGVRWVWRDGPRQGFAANFLSGLSHVGRDITHVALCDQDDVWLPDKLARAVAALDGIDGPALVAGRTWVCDADLAKLHLSRTPSRPPAFANALVQNVAAGNTIVLNRTALDLLATAQNRIGLVAAHDWWIYQLVTGAGGRVLWQDDPCLLYRQHRGNSVGANAGLRAGIGRILQMFAGRYQRWNDLNLAALDAVQDLLTPEARAMIAAFRTARTAPVYRRLGLLAKSGVWRQSWRGQMSLKAAALLGRI